MSSTTSNGVRKSVFVDMLARLHSRQQYYIGKGFLINLVGVSINRDRSASDLIRKYLVLCLRRTSLFQSF